MVVCTSTQMEGKPQITLKVVRLAVLSKWTQPKEGLQCRPRSFPSSSWLSLSFSGPRKLRSHFTSPPPACFITDVSLTILCPSRVLVASDSELSNGNNAAHFLTVSHSWDCSWLCAQNVTEVVVWSAWKKSLSKKSNSTHYKYFCWSILTPLLVCHPGCR